MPRCPFSVACSRAVFPYWPRALTLTPAARRSFAMSVLPTEAAAQRASSLLLASAPASIQTLHMSTLSNLAAASKGL
jgi:hypothetical protein